jgi:hypothetical protein
LSFYNELRQFFPGSLNPILPVKALLLWGPPAMKSGRGWRTPQEGESEMKALVGKQSRAREVVKFPFFEGVERIVIKKVFTWGLKISMGILFLAVLGLGITLFFVPSLALTTALLGVSTFSLFLATLILTLKVTGFHRLFGLSNPTNVSPINAVAGYGVIATFGLILATFGLILTGLANFLRIPGFLSTLNASIQSLLEGQQGLLEGQQEMLELLRELLQRLP